MERRFIPINSGTMKIEKRADGGNVITGYGAVFYDANDAGTEYMLYPGMRERIMPGAFDQCIRERYDVAGLFNHEPDNLLGRVSSGTMRLSVDSRGLRYEIDLPDTQIGRDVAAMIGRGDLKGSSFSFNVVRQSIQYNQTSPNDSDDDDDIRELMEVDVIDVGPVVFPAYQSTTTGIRAIGTESEMRSICEQIAEPRGVVRFQNHPLIEDDEWDADAAMSRVKAWASEGDRMSMRKFSRAFAWHDGSSTEAGHRMLHHDVRDGKLHTHRGAVKNCLRMIDEEDGGGVPEDERKACRSHLERHRSWDDEEDGDEDEWDDRQRMLMRQQMVESDL